MTRPSPEQKRELVQRLTYKIPPHEALLQINRAMCEQSLAKFVETAWPYLPGAGGEYKPNWHIEATCLPGTALITTPGGPVRIETLVENGYSGSVLSFNHGSGDTEWRRVLASSKSPPRPLLHVQLTTGEVVRLTENHPVYVIGEGYCPAVEVRIGDAVYVQTLRERISPLSSQTTRRILRDEVLRRIKEEARETTLRVREIKGLGSKILCQLLGGAKTTTTWIYHTMSAVWGGDLSFSSPMESKFAKAWSILQPRMSRRLYEGDEQSCLYTWPQWSELLGFISENEEDSSREGRKQMRSMREFWENLRASYRCTEIEQCRVEFGNALSEMPQVSAYREDAYGYYVFQSTVSSIKREVCLPDAVYNIEVEGNNNYFANGILVHNCEHLEAVTRGEIKRLLVNQPPRSLKSLLISVSWPMWTWAQTHKSPLSGADVKFLCASYNQDLAWDLSTAARRLVVSPFYQQRWGRRFTLTSDQNTKTRFDNSAGGSRIATSVGGSLLGLGGSILILDDPHNIDGLTEVERLTAIEWFKEFSSTRFNDPATGALVVVMQRLHQMDISGYILESDTERRYVHIKLPMEFDPDFIMIPTPLGFIDPRSVSETGGVATGEELESRRGWLLHPQRVSREDVEKLKETLGPYLASGRLQQDPVPEGGAIIKEAWWNLWPNARFPPMGTVIVGLDSALTEKEENDYSAITVWGAYADPETGLPRMMLMDAWHRRLAVNDLVMQVAATCKEHKADILLIESKANGHNVYQEIQRLYGIREWQTLLITPKGDKVSRVNAIQPFFAAGMVYSPDKEFAQTVIEEFKFFPKGAHDDLVDSTSMVLNYMRNNSIAITKEEFDEEKRAERLSRAYRHIDPVYDC